MCDWKRTEEQNPLFFSVDKCASAVNSQATVCARIDSASSFLGHNSGLFAPINFERPIGNLQRSAV